jgi:hypothetical protein
MKMNRVFYEDKAMSPMLPLRQSIYPASKEKGQTAISSQCFA